jgi:hypothetical protein
MRQFPRLDGTQVSRSGNPAKGLMSDVGQSLQGRPSGKAGHVQYAAALMRVRIWGLHGAGALALIATAAQAQYLGTGSNPNSHPVQGYTTNGGTYMPLRIAGATVVPKCDFGALGALNFIAGPIWTFSSRMRASPTFTTQPACQLQ